MAHMVALACDNAYATSTLALCSPANEYVEPSAAKAEAAVTSVIGAPLAFRGDTTNSFA